MTHHRDKILIFEEDGTTQQNTAKRYRRLSKWYKQTNAEMSISPTSDWQWPL